MKPSSRCLTGVSSLRYRPSTIGFVGLGRMGYEMAYNLFSKQHVKDTTAQFAVCDAVPDCSRSFRDKFLQQFPNANVTIASTPQETAQASQTIITMLPSSPEVRIVYLEAIIPTLQRLSEVQTRATLCIDCTTLDVAVAQNIAGRVIRLGAEIVDAPVSGGVTGAKAGTLSFLVGGPQASFQRSEMILSLMGQRIIHCGPSGSGLGAKICNNLILGVQQIVVGEAMILGQRLGLAPSVLAGVINSSTGGCWASSVNNPVPSALTEHSPPCERDYEGGFATSLMQKDMGLAADIAKQVGSPLPLGEAAKNIYDDMLKKEPNLSRKDFSSVYQFLDRSGL